MQGSIYIKVYITAGTVLKAVGRRWGRKSHVQIHHSCDLWPLTSCCITGLWCRVMRLTELVDQKLFWILMYSYRWETNTICRKMFLTRKLFFLQNQNPQHIFSSWGAEEGRGDMEFHPRHVIMVLFTKELTHAVSPCVWGIWQSIYNHTGSHKRAIQWLPMMIIQ